MSEFVVSTRTKKKKRKKIHAIFHYVNHKYVVASRGIRDYSASGLVISSQRHYNMSFILNHRKNFYLIRHDKEILLVKLTYTNLEITVIQ